MLDDGQLLRSYASEGSQTAFGKLVTRHVNLVYSAALRRTSGDEQLAKDVAQLVFTDLARKAHSLSRNVVLPGWLHQATRFAAAQLIRTERRRQAREQEAVAMNALESEPAPDWAEIRPLLDDALDELGDADRDAVVLRFFEQGSFAQVGQALGATEDAARKRISRALDKLREALVRRGIATTGAALSAVISTNAVQAAPAGLAVTISTAAAMAGTTIAATATATATKAIVMTTLQKTLIGATLTAAIGVGIYEARQASHLRREVQTLRQQQTPLTEQVQQLTREKNDMSRRLATSDANAVKRQREEMTAKGKPSLAEIEAKIQELSGAGYLFSDRRRDTECQKFADSIDPADIPQTLAVLDRVGSKNVRDTFRNVLLARWAETDPKAAAAFAGTMPAGPERNGLINILAEEWAQSDLNSAVAWAKQLPDVHSREDALWNIVPHWAQTDPEGALAYAQSLTAGHTQNRILERIAATLGSTDATKAMELVNRLPAGSDQDTFIVGMAEGMAQNSPQEAANFVSKLPVGEAQKLAAVMVAMAWLSTDPQSAAAWVSAFPAGETRDKVVKNVLRVWTNSDPQAAGKWLASLPAGKDQEPPVQYYINSVYSKYPDLAAPWVETITDPSQRNSSIEKIARAWLETDPTAAQAWVAKTSLPDDLKQLLLK